MESDNLVRLLSLKERKEAIMEHLEWIDQQEAIVQQIFQRRMAWYENQRMQAMNAMREVIREETEGRNT